MLDARGIEVAHRTVRFWRHRFGLVFVSEIRNGLSTVGWS
jgi:transposase-like protein